MSGMAAAWLKKGAIARRSMETVGMLLIEEVKKKDRAYTCRYFHLMYYITVVIYGFRYHLTLLHFSGQTFRVHRGIIFLGGGCRYWPIFWRGMLTFLEILDLVTGHAQGQHRLMGATLDQALSIDPTIGPTKK